MKQRQHISRTFFNFITDDVMSREKRIDRRKSKGLQQDYLVMDIALWDDIETKIVILLTYIHPSTPTVKTKEVILRGGPTSVDGV